VTALKCAEPSDFPVEQAIKFVKIVNLKTAKALSLMAHRSTELKFFFMPPCGQTAPSLYNGG
jgi:hypothetical protein